jgi:hypothetical protein
VDDPVARLNVRLLHLGSVDCHHTLNTETEIELKKTKFGTVL